MTSAEKMQHKANIISMLGILKLWQDRSVEAKKPNKELDQLSLISLEIVDAFESMERQIEDLKTQNYLMLKEKNNIILNLQGDERI
jgi:hypothetical protein|tara:strand:+ start:1221 stop:1478 length:258 start_codon:yes stop_codon:yes gene_type:complete